MGAIDQQEGPASLAAMNGSEPPLDSFHVNSDLAPTTLDQRRWGVKDIAALWISMSACIPTYMLASSLIAEGMNWWQAVLTIFLGNCDRAGADGPERPRGDEVRHPVPDLLPGVVRHPRGERARAVARPGRLRLVRHPDLDRRRGDLQDPGHLRSRPGRQLAADRAAGHQRRRKLACFLAFWAINMRRHLPGHRLDPLPAEHQGPAADRAGAGAAGLGLRAGGRLRADAGAALAVRPGQRQGRPVLGVLLPGADRR